MRQLRPQPQQEQRAIQSNRVQHKRYRNQSVVKFLLLESFHPYDRVLCFWLLLFLSPISVPLPLDKTTPLLSVGLCFFPTPPYQPTSPIPSRGLYTTRAGTFAIDRLRVAGPGPCSCCCESLPSKRDAALTNQEAVSGRVMVMSRDGRWDKGGQHQRVGSASTISCWRGVAVALWGTGEPAFATDTRKVLPCRWIRGLWPNSRESLP